MAYTPVTPVTPPPSPVAEHSFPSSAHAWTTVSGPLDATALLAFSAQRQCWVPSARCVVKAVQRMPRLELR